MITINWATKVIYVPRLYLTDLGGGIYEFDVNAFRLALRDLEDSNEGIAFPPTHRHNTTVTLSGVTYARTVEIINGYTIEFETGLYTVKCVGANHNIADVKVVNSVSLLIGNSAGLIEGGGGNMWNEVIETGYTAANLLRLIAAVAAGKSSVVGSTVKFRDMNDTKDRIDATVVGGARTSVTRDGT